MAIWRTVTCESCGALITRTESLVTRDSFRKALVRATADSAIAGGVIGCAGWSYLLMGLLGDGEISQVHVGRRIGMLPFLVTIKLSSASVAAKRYAREAEVLRELRAADAGGYFTHLLPEVVAHGAVEGDDSRQALVFRQPIGFWGSLAALNERYGQGIDPRHAVWIWRRILEALNLLHQLGWSHGGVRPEHALVHPGDHGVRLIGWENARSNAGTQAQAADLMRGARVVLVLLSGSSDTGMSSGLVPAELSQLVTRASHDEDFCRSQGASGLDTLLQAAAKSAFGPPKFVPMIL